MTWALVKETGSFLGIVLLSRFDSLLDKHTGLVSEKYQIEQNQGNKVQKQSDFIQSQIGIELVFSLVQNQGVLKQSGKHHDESK